MSCGTPGAKKDDARGVRKARKLMSNPCTNFRQAGQLSGFAASASPSHHTRSGLADGSAGETAAPDSVVKLVLTEWFRFSASSEPLLRDFVSVFSADALMVP